MTSYLDKMGHVSDIYELNGTTYSYNGAVLRSHDFTDFTRVTKIGTEQRMLFNLAATDMSEVFYSDLDMNVAMVSPTVYELTTLLDSLVTTPVSERPFSVSLARDRLHQYICT